MYHGAEGRGKGRDRGGGGGVWGVGGLQSCADALSFCGERGGAGAVLPEEGEGGGVRQVIYDRVYRIVDRQEGRSVGRSIK